MNTSAAVTARRSLAFIGTNAGLALHPVDAGGLLLPGEPASCFASFWMADWSRWGVGHALLVATRQGWRSYGTDAFFAASLATELTRHFPEAARFPLDGISHTGDEFDVELDAGQGLRATGRKAELEISGVLDRRQFAAPNFQLGNASAALSNVYLPCSTGRLTEFGVEWPGAATMYPGPLGPASSAFLAVAESRAL
ncbi:hypothetical protein [Arthrobacter sp. Leaf69]|uniref:hypothetical protein n=1 Tax=Arthrobacter sp. Leaf69 TaxID=1736232 RepID=UPI0006FF3FA1|nr:hypothetical protein [Arthrobacter sp. Leaf69]KQN89201.1 hypothetical protein ASE96_06285 [Arthrobacter sp. Leaf69]